MKNSIYNIWKNYGKNVWFKSTRQNDEMIKEDLGKFLPQLDNLEIYFDRMNLIEGIILTDQIARHIYRNNESLIKQYGEKAIFYAEEFLKYYTPENNYELLFVCLPLRHYPNQNRINKVYDVYNSYLKQNPLEINYITNLKKTTKKRYKLFLRNNKEFNTDSKGNIFDKDILDKNSYNNTNFDLNKLINSCEYKYFSSRLQNEKFLLSLSGGIDSIVILLLLLGIRKEKNINFEAFHLNYQKRKESIAEEEYLKRLCDSNNIPFHIRQINNCDKNLNLNWENATRIQRFSYYKQILNERKLDSVILGHHRDDIDENILMNLFSTGSSNNTFIWSDLSGMTCKQLINNVNIYRPFIDLNIRKNWIFNLAKIYKVPYFNDSSFDLATRIRVRKELIPLMEQIFNDTIYFKLNTISCQSKELELLIKNKVKSYIQNENIIIELNNILEANIPISISVFAFIDSIKSYIYKLNYNLPSHKSVYNVLNIISNKHKKKNKYNTNNSKFIFSSNCYGLYNLKNMKMVLYFHKNNI